jgi:hypothetical protein
MTINDGGPAFPVPNDANVNGQAGMSLRAWLAGTVAAGYRAGRMFNAGAYPSESRLWSPQQVAREAIRDADALIAELSKGTERKPE